MDGFHRHASVPATGPTVTRAPLPSAGTRPPQRRGVRVRLLAVLTFPDTDELEVHLTFGGRRIIGRSAAGAGAIGAATATVEGSPPLAEVLDAVASGMFSPDDKSRYRGLVDALTHHDYFMVTADFEAYREAQRAVGALWHDQNAWWRIAVLNTARMSWFSSDRAILDYAQEIWRAEPSLP